MDEITLKKEIADLEAQLKPKKELLSKILHDKANSVDERIRKCNKLEDKFLPEELRFAAVVRCLCGSGMAYPLDMSMHGSWYCSAILLGEGDLTKPHQSPMSFSFYSIKSEDQPSARGATTRPQK